MWAVLGGEAHFRGALVAGFLPAPRSNSGAFRPPGSRPLHTPPEVGLSTQNFITPMPTNSTGRLADDVSVVVGAAGQAAAKGAFAEAVYGLVGEGVEGAVVFLGPVGEELGGAFGGVL